jgi:FtsZ-interacting cell division protein ZipA
MDKKNRIIYIVIAIIGIMLTVWWMDAVQAKKRLEQDIKILKDKRAEADREWKARVEALEKEVTVAHSEIEKRKKPITATRNVPADCKKCIEQWKCPYTCEDQEKIFKIKTPDCLTGQPCTIEIDQKKFHEAFIKPCDNTLQECIDKLEDKPSKFFDVAHQVSLAGGVGFNDYKFRVKYTPGAMGTKSLRISPFIETGAEVGITIPEPAIDGMLGIEVIWKR